MCSALTFFEIPVESDGGGIRTKTETIGLQFGHTIGQNDGGINAPAAFKSPFPDGGQRVGEGNCFQMPVIVKSFSLNDFRTVADTIAG